MRARDTVSMFLPRLRIGFAERVAELAAAHHHLERLLAGADAAHAVVDAPGAETHLADLEAAALAEQHVVDGYAHVGEPQVHVSVRRVVVTEHVHRAEDLDAGRVHRHEDL